MRIAKVVIEHPINHLDLPFDYYIPNGMKVMSGIRVYIQFHQQNIVGYVLEVFESPQSLEEYQQEHGFELKPLLAPMDETPLFTPELDALASWLAYRSVSPLVACYQAMLPPALKPTSGAKRTIKTVTHIRAIEPLPLHISLTQKQLEAYQQLCEQGQVLKKDCLISPSILKTLRDKGCLEAIKVEVYRNPFRETVTPRQGPVLTKDQQAALLAIRSAPQTTILLEGVTGSGKTEIYIHLALETLKQGKNVLILVPEISLTPQMVRRFKERMDVGVAILHSALGDGEKYDEYRRISKNEVRVVIGARSAVFAPLANIGLIVLDEEHSDSYKQDSTPRYHARDVALERANHHHARVVLGSATPSLESKARALKGVYGMVYLPHRIGLQEMPSCRIVDMAQESRQGNYSVFSRELQQALRETVAKKEQAILLLNRRGYTPFVQCRTCQHVFRCPDCDVSLTYHRDVQRLKCHYCGHEEPYPTRCPSCQGTYFARVGIGTQKLEEEVRKLLPEARVVRMDLDSVRQRAGHQMILDAFERHEYDILLGTQMIAKGLDYPRVTLVGVLHADTGLFSGNYRGSETTFQLLTQVAGRSGRGDQAGRAIIQSFNPTHYAIQYASHHDYPGFYVAEMKYRYEGKYPPYRFLSTLTFSARTLESAEAYALRMKAFFMEQSKGAIEVLGPAQPYIAQINRRFRLRLLLKYKDEALALRLLNDVKKTSQTEKGIDVQFDVNPLGE